MKKKKGFPYICKLSVSRCLSVSLLPYFLIVRLLACSMLRTFHWRRYNSHHHRRFFTSVSIGIEVEVLWFGLSFFSCKKREKEWKQSKAKKKERKKSVMIIDVSLVVTIFWSLYEITVDAIDQNKTKNYFCIDLNYIYIYICTVNRLNKWEVIRLFYVVLSI